jgi:hypothetical protein
MKKKARKSRTGTNAAEISAALRKESDRALIETIRYRLSLPAEKRLNVLRRKIGLRATSLQHLLFACFYDMLIAL